MGRKAAGIMGVQEGQDTSGESTVGEAFKMLDVSQRCRKEAKVVGAGGTGVFDTIDDQSWGTPDKF